MKTPREKYLNDDKYKYFVDMIESFIHKADFTPSEIREMCLLACINYEMKTARSVEIPVHLNDAFISMEDFMEKPQKQRR